jgi:hypothetical protein
MVGLKRLLQSDNLLTAHCRLQTPQSSEQVCVEAEPSSAKLESMQLLLAGVGYVGECQAGYFQNAVWYRSSTLMGRSVARVFHKECEKKIEGVALYSGISSFGWAQDCEG